MRRTNEGAGARGANHVALEGAATGFRFRSERVPATALSGELEFRFEMEGRAIGPHRVLDLSSTGLGVCTDELFLPPGATLERAELWYRGSCLWSGSAEVAYQVDSPSPRLGVRFTSGAVDVKQVRTHDSVLGGVEAELSRVARVQATLQPEYRALVCDVAQLLSRVRGVLERAEAELPQNDPLARRDEELEIIETVHRRWAPSYHDLLRQLYDTSMPFSEAEQELSKQYATEILLPLLHCCPAHGRAYDKPLGYAGDYQQMRVCASPEPLGDSLYARFLHFSAQQYGLGRAVLGRVDLMSEEIRKLASTHRPTRIASLACGPALEIARVLAELEGHTGPLELVLIDQDEGALAYCHRSLSKLLSARPELRVRLKLLHLSVRQIMLPKNDAERRAVAEDLSGLDFLYSAGLFDYMSRRVAQRLVSKLWRLLAPGGRLFIGNLTTSPDSAWILDHVLAWHLEYRTRADMEELIDGLSPAPVDRHVITDRSGQCLFLDARRADFDP